MEIFPAFKMTLNYSFKDDLEGWKLNCSIVTDNGINKASNLEGDISPLLTIRELKECFNELLKYLKEANNG